ncbi:MAG: hypothetical protein COT39_04045 [Parcubacteria group bacterium CG08_land_8_20_14_0_20_48_21]|nr:MAG: hypothetical protein AUK21_00600 [Parcubacteria group bacterium CG2_30_48_51]PIS32530.1 MAG: hypothetical protein COT39_04045 [Parcubacteria group bacterium CG08_land_8_20_14_0_20_48_21]PIW79481.1 MAG: hypothetical protein COZ99_00805 [Parcubacteria group bacterium CG_4_8_14_3_um_filter_48_16]PIY77912.1 MAG: hypothetical protein COY83_02560 [Parcubacteria group bacterium CG_4_10_14_0_8_um_filter_48_154]PIZ77783.1 MAG: hypothetical protein COY03_01645 [bacterium CG_4_10_14_0_2_um_filter_
MENEIPFLHRSGYCSYDGPASFALIREPESTEIQKISTPRGRRVTVQEGVVHVPYVHIIKKETVSLHITDVQDKPLPWESDAIRVITNPNSNKIIWIKQ